ncbi:winged helix-turn-helix transcriptional regulator [Streptomyces sp. NBC_01465]|uniref:winged helix-turn-helix transcriptional regulator n=1 Tax=Streptomyces sp. NBC_01465 TaxID=2903878 RepID=UPI002E31DCF4|nr:helix-turn-helix domain-containing protein [Streptomyces sp. NBC_01465]
MALPRDYTTLTCALSRSLEIIGERWTLLIVRDAFYGVRRFGDFASHLNIPRAVLTDRLTALVEADVLERTTPPGTRREVYGLTSKGLSLWPAVRALSAWGDEHYAPPAGPRRIFRHAQDDAPLTPDGHCTHCKEPVPVRDILITPGPGLSANPTNPTTDEDPVSRALRTPHRLLTPLPPPKGQHP